MKRLVVIDWLGFAMRVAMSVNSDRYERHFPATPEFEHKEIAIRLAKQLYLMQKQYGWVGGIIATDDRGNYWRTLKMREWYLEWAKYAKREAEEAVSEYLLIDNKVYMIAPDGCKESREMKMADVPADLTWEPVPERFHDQLPRYKGNRKNKAWMLATAPDDFYKYINYWHGLFAALLNCKAIKVPLMEADDICAVASTRASADWNVDIVTADSDYHQLAVDPNVRVIDLGKGIIRSDKANEILKSLGGKILGGDRGDNISGMPKGGKGCLTHNPDGSGSGDKLCASFTGTTKQELVQFLLSMGDTPKLRFNAQMISLPSKDPLIVAPIDAAIKATTVLPSDKGWDWFGLDKAMRDRLDDQAMTAEFISLFNPSEELLG